MFLLSPAMLDLQQVLPFHNKCMFGLRITLLPTTGSIIDVPALRHVHGFIQLVSPVSPFETFLFETVKGF